jgi:putative ABC transport system substrate-binding protein
MRRRDFLAGLGVAAVWPVGARAQQPAKIPRVVFASPATPLAGIETDDPGYAAMLGELRRLGYVEGRNLAIERRSAEGRPETYAAIAREVAGLNPDAVVVASAKFALAFKAATNTVPVVAQSLDPVGSGLVPDLAHPGGNITGVASGGAVETLGVYFEILRAIDPGISRIGFLTDAASGSMWEALQSTVRGLAAMRYGVTLVGKPIAGPVGEAEYRQAITAMLEQGASALIVDDTVANDANAALIADLASANRLLSISGNFKHAKEGCLVSCAPDLDDAFRQIAGYVDRILRGEKAGDLPFAQLTTYRLAINLRTAKALGLEIPPQLLAHADEVIK